MVRNFKKLLAMPSRVRVVSAAAKVNMGRN
jgi:hypothetical protein